MGETTVQVSLTELAELFQQRAQPVFYVSRTATHLVGVEHFVPQLSFVTLVDSWLGTHPSVFVPTSVPNPAPRGNINVINWMLRSPEVLHHMRSRTPEGLRPQVMLAFFDETSEQLCREAGLDLIMPSHALRTRLDSKMVTTRLGESAGVPSVPNIITRITGWEDLVSQAEAGGLGRDWVVQTAYGNSGETTYFIASEHDFAGASRHIVGPEIKVMRRINHLPLAVDAVVTKGGTVVGPLLSEVTGFAELTQHAGGWSGNEMSERVMSPSARDRGTEMVRRFGDQLAAEGYKGTFGIDLLIDTDTDEVYLGEMNPRLTGTMSITNIPTGAFAALPLIALHLLAYADELGVSIDPQAIEQEARAHGQAEWSHMIIRATQQAPARLLSVPVTGVYRRDASGALSLREAARDWHGLEGDDVFVLNTVSRGNFRTLGSDLAIVYTRHRVQTNERVLTEDARDLIAAVHGLYETRELTPLQNAVRKARLLGAMLSGR